MSNCRFLTLDNGLTILIYSDKSKITNYAMLTTFLGGLNRNFTSYKGKEKKMYPGTAHLLEHYVLENCCNGNLLDNLFDNRVLSSNGITNETETSFYFSTVHNFDKCLELFLNGVYNPIFTTDKLEKTKYAVLNEIRDDKDNSRERIIYTKISNIFSNYVNNLGNKSSVDKIGIRYLKEVYDNFYVPKNQLLVVAGNFEEEKMLDFIKKIYAEFEFKCNRRMLINADKREVVKKDCMIRIGTLDKVIISYKIDTNKMNAFQKYKFDWYLNYFASDNFSRFSKFNELLKGKDIITGDVSVGVYRLYGYTILEVLAYTDKKKKFIDGVFEVIKSFRSNKESDFELSKKISKTDISVRRDKITDYVLPVVDNYTSFDYPYDDTLDFIDSLNFEEYLDTISKIDFSNYSIFCVKKER